ncbi:MAG: hypothetical protein AB2N28_3660 [Candidatus Phytoplasma solani]
MLKKLIKNWCICFVIYFLVTITCVGICELITQQGFFAQSNMKRNLLIVLITCIFTTSMSLLFDFHHEAIVNKCKPCDCKTKNN